MAAALPRDGRSKAVQVGGPLGACPNRSGTFPLDYEAYAAIGAGIGHGGIVVHDDQADLSRLARYAMEFCAIESCGKCTRRVASARRAAGGDRPRSAPTSSARSRWRFARSVRHHGARSLCAMGSMTPIPVTSA